VNLPSSLNENPGAQSAPCSLKRSRSAPSTIGGNSTSALASSVEASANPPSPSNLSLLVDRSNKELRSGIIKTTTTGNRGVFLWNDWKASTFDPRNPYSTYRRRVLTQVIVKVEDQLKFYKSQIGRAKSATALAWQMLSMCVPSKMILRSIYP
jgi:hypothetical protein